MEQNPYQPPATESDTPLSGTESKVRLVQMKYLLRVTYLSLTVAFAAIAAMFFLQVSGSGTVEYLVGAIVGFAALIAVLIAAIANVWLFGLSIVSCARTHHGFAYLAASLVLPGLVAFWMLAF